MHRIKKDALFLLDASYLLYRSFYAIKPLHTSTGIPTQATYGFCRAIKKLMDKFDPENLVIAWDTKGKNFRNEIYPEYKATRSAPPSDLHMQKEYILKVLDLVGACQVSQAGVEADDLLASLAHENKDKQIVLVGPDKDMYQLLSKNLMIFDPFKERLIDEETFTNEHGFGPEKLNFYYSLLGDESDNIPGVSGIGKKTAQELVQKFESLDALYKNLDKVERTRTRELLTQQQEQAFLSQKLFSLKIIPIHLKSDDMKFSKESWSKAKPIFEELEFGSMFKDGGKETFKEGEKKQPDSTTNLPEVNYDWKCHVVQTDADLNRLIEKIKSHGSFALDTETTGLSPLQDAMVGASFAVNDKEAYYIPFIFGTQPAQLSIVEVAKNSTENGLDIKHALKLLKPVLEDENIYKFFHHAKFDKLVFYQYGIDIKGVSFDSILAASLVKNEWQKINLKDLSLFFLNERMLKFKEALDGYKNFGDVPLDKASKYAAHDALQTFKLKKVLFEELKKHPKLLRIFEEIEMPVSEILFKMEAKGIGLDIDVLKEVEKEVNREVTAIELKIFAAFEHLKLADSFNLNSPKQVESLLFDELKLPVVKKSGKGQRSTDQEVLQELSKVHPIPALILRHRELSKLKNTYLKPLPEFVNPKTGRIHTTYSQTMVATGRLSSSDPNLQNIPTSSEYGMKIRTAFVAPREKCFISADYSQIELRVLACITGDVNLVSAFLHDKDIHAQTAAQLFGVPLNEVTHDQRQLGKRINFSIIYGLTPYGLSKDLGIKPSEAKTYIEKYFENYPKVAEWLSQTVVKAVSDGYVETWWGRRRYITELREKNHTLFEAGKRIATNTPIQGTSAEIMKLAMINVDRAIQRAKLNADIVLQIHDELVVEVANDSLEDVMKIVQKEMESVVDWTVPFKVSLRTGKNWGDITK